MSTVGIRKTVYRPLHVIVRAYVLYIFMYVGIYDRVHGIYGHTIANGFEHANPINRQYSGADSYSYKYTSIRPNGIRHNIIQYIL